MSERPIQAVVIGAGAIARQHLGCLQGLHEVEIAGICDLSPAVAESMAERYGLNCSFTDHTRMLDDVRPDVVHITTPPATHFPLAMDAIACGAHVIVEKPITRTLEELATLQRLAAAKNCHIVEDHNYLYNTPVRRMLDLVRTGELGTVVHVDATICLNLLEPGGRYMDHNAPHPCLGLPGGALADFATHLASLAWLFVGPHQSVHTTWSKTTDSPLPAEDVHAVIGAERGTATLAFSTRAQPDLFRVRLEGTRMRVEADLFEPRFVTERLHGGPRPLIPFRNGLARARAEHRAAIGGLWRKFSGGPGAYEGLWALLAAVYAAIRNGSPPPVSEEQVLGVNALVAELTRQVSSSEYACAP